MKYIVGINELKTVGDNIQKYAENDLHSNIFALHKIKLNMKWQGPAKQMFSEKFDASMEKLYQMEHAIELYGDFLSYCSEHYGECAKELQAGWEEHLNELEDKLEEKKKIDMIIRGNDNE